MDTRPSVTIRGTGSYAPEAVLSNDDLTARLDTSDEWIRTRTGIRERRVADSCETAATMGLRAAKKALVSAGCEPADVDLVICATVTPDMMSPSTACLISAGLGCRPVPAFDVTAACSGFIFALSVGEQFVKSGEVQRALIVGSDLLSRVVDHEDRNTCLLFGDAAGAVLLERADDPTRGLHRVRLFADGTRQELIQVPSRMSAEVMPELKFLKMNGREVFKFAVGRLTELIRQALTDCQELGKELKWIVPHQVNSRIIDSALETVGHSRDKVIMNLEKYGNTSAASIPLALDQAVRQGKLNPGDTILLAAFGGGLTWSSALLTL